MMPSEIERCDQELLVATVAFESQEGILVTNANQVILRANSSSQVTGYSAKRADIAM